MAAEKSGLWDQSDDYPEIAANPVPDWAMIRAAEKNLVGNFGSCMDPLCENPLAAIK